MSGVKSEASLANNITDSYIVWLWVQTDPRMTTLVIHQRDRIISLNYAEH